MDGQCCEQLASTHPAAINIVLLHGWSFDAEVWRASVVQLRQWANITLVDVHGVTSCSGGEPADVDAVIAGILANAPRRAVYIGWSLGGSLATRLAAKYPERVDALITLATNPCFTANADWPEAMSQEDFSKFSSLVSNRCEAGLKRFDSLQAQGESRAKEFRQWLKKVRPRRYEKRDLLLALQWLQQIDNRAALSEIHCPTLHIFADQDAIVPVGVAEFIKQFNGDHQVKIIGEAGHALIWNRADHLLELSQVFLQEQLKAISDENYSARFDKQLLAKSFSKAATTYDSVAKLQRRVGEQLLENFGSTLSEIESFDADNKTVLDLGSGTGYFASRLQDRCNASTYIGFDLAEGMLNFANAGSDQTANWCCGDAENLPFAAESFAVIFSSLTIQWCEHLPALFSEIWRTLKPGGVFLFSTLGPETLCELRQAWRAADDYVHVNEFTDFDSLKQLTDAHNFTERNSIEQTITLQYAELKELTAELKSLGAHNINRGRQTGLTSRAQLRKFKEAYESQRIAGLLPATYQIYYGMLKK